MGRPTVLSKALQAENSFDSIPIIDFQHATNPDPIIRRRLADEIRDTCIKVGFFYIKNHGVPENLATEAIEEAKKFFALPEPVKLELDIHKTPNYKGYTALLSEKTDVESDGDGDMHEGFDFGWEPFDEGEAGRDLTSYSGPMAGSNVWPSDMPQLRQTALAYYHAVVRLGLSLFPLLALALDLPETFFDDKTTKPAAIMRFLHYPPQLGHVDDRIIGIGAHTDYECFTILWQDDVSGLQVLNTEGKWIDARPIPGTFVLNLGDQLARWTNDVFKSTVHRAVNKTGVRRYSMPLFFGTDYHVKLEPLPSCVSPEYPSKYEVVTAGEYVKSRLEHTYAHSK